MNPFMICFNNGLASNECLNVLEGIANAQMDFRNPLRRAEAI